jgi:archaemetzincin
VKVRLVALGPLPPRLAAAVLAGLPTPFAADDSSLEADLPSDCHDRARGQTDAARLLDALPPPAAGGATLGLTASDLFLPPLAYVFGLSPLGGRRALLSCARLREAGEAAGDRLVQRTLIEAVHELGHAAGLVHCPVTECAMHRSLWPEAVDLKRPRLCPTCAAELALLVG